MDDDFGDDAELAAAVAAVERSYTPKTAAAAASSTTKVQQPQPQALPNRASPSSILVSPRQRGNPLLNHIRSVAWQYSDIPADYVLGHTRCALFLSLKYHRLHPEYIYSRIRALAGKYNLRVLLTLVDIQNHEESLKELSKTSLINNLTLILCWSAQEAGHYLELYKSYEHAAPTSIRAQQATSYSEKLVEFITVPRSINKTDAVGLVSNFGSVRAAVNARPEEIGLIAGWGEKKVQRWCSAVREPFRVRKAAKKGVGLGREGSSIGFSRENSRAEGADDVEFSSGISDRPPPYESSMAFVTQTSGLVPSNEGATPDADRRPPAKPAENMPPWNAGQDEEEALLIAMAEEERSHPNEGLQQPSSANTRKADVSSGDAGMSDGVMAALAKLRKEQG